MMIYSCFPSLDQAQDGFVCVFLVCFAEPREKNGKRKRDGEERREKKLGGKRETGKTKGKRGHKDRKTKE